MSRRALPAESPDTTARASLCPCRSTSTGARHAARPSRSSPVSPNATRRPCVPPAAATTRPGRAREVLRVDGGALSGERDRAEDPGRVVAAAGGTHGLLVAFGETGDDLEGLAACRAPVLVERHGQRLARAVVSGDSAGKARLDILTHGSTPSIGLGCTQGHTLASGVSWRRGSKGGMGHEQHNVPTSTLGTAPLRTPGARARVAVPPVRREPRTVRRRTPGGARSSTLVPPQRHRRRARPGARPGGGPS